ncbi:MAG: hypothetical protein E3J72_07430 [Planctomycetota bacterium]|nr:MAG: hypothetical protein E3J72_07430 [Planctomycetota bacterium]
MSDAHHPAGAEPEISSAVMPKTPNLFAAVIVIMVIIICGGAVACVWIHYRSELEKHRESVGELTERLEKAEKERDNYKIRIDALMGMGIPIEISGNIPQVPQIDAVVTAYKEAVRLVVLNVGSEHGVKTGYRFTIYDGGNFVAQVEVEKVMPRLCGTRVIFSAGDIREGMAATTRLE